MNRDELPSELRAAIAVVLEHVHEWEFDDNPRERNVCGSCGWNSTTAPERFLSHYPGCELQTALALLREVSG